jgi:large subunit ribosomal protein L24
MKKAQQYTKKLHIKVGQKVKVISGKDKGKIGTVKSLLKKANKVIVEGINF